MAGGLIHESVWLNKYKYDDAERSFYESKAKEYRTPLAAEVGKAREWLTNIKKCIEEPHCQQQQSEPLPANTLKALEAQVNKFTQVFSTFEKKLDDLLTRVKKLEDARSAVTTTVNSAPSKPAAEKPSAKQEDDGIDLFGSDSEEDEGANELREKRLAEYAAKKSKKPGIIAKSNIILDVKPWDDETNMKELETEVRKIQMEGLVWGASKLVPLAYGIHKLQISCVVEDDLVSVDALQEQIEEIENYVQSVDIVAFNKV